MDANRRGYLRDQGNDGGRRPDDLPWIAARSEKAGIDPSRAVHGCDPTAEAPADEVAVGALIGKRDGSSVVHEIDRIQELHDMFAPRGPDEDLGGVVALAVDHKLGPDAGAQVGADAYAAVLGGCG